jgi:hypothetical protein
MFDRDLNLPGHKARVHPAFESLVDEANETRSDWSRPIANLRDEFHQCSKETACR